MWYIIRNDKIFKGGNSTQAQKRNNLIDVLKCAACFAVILLHFATHEFEQRGILLQTAIGRCAVPIFFMISGYFASLKPIEKQAKGFLRGAVRMAVYYVIFEVILYFLHGLARELTDKDRTFATLDFSFRRIKEFFLFNEPFFATYLWYLLSYMYCLIIYAVAVKIKPLMKLIAIATPFLLIGYIALGRYSVIFFDKGLDLIYSRNFLFAALPMFTVGYYMNKIKRPVKSDAGMLFLIGISLFLLYCEALSFLRSPSIDSGRNNYFMNLVVAFLVTKLATSTERNTTSDNPLAVIGRKYSLYIYLLQYIANELLKVIFFYTKRYPFGKLMYNFYGFAKPVMVFAAALLLSMLAYRIERLIVSLISKKSDKPQKAA